MKASVLTRNIMLLGIALLLSSCFSSGAIGRKFDTTHVNDIKDGVTTKETIRQWFGEPYATGAAEPEMKQAGCVDGWTYLYAFLSNSESLAVYFDADGKVCVHAYAKK